MAKAVRERKCLVTGEVLPSERMIRFVLGPENVIVPDLAARLPGRGCWLKADRKLLDRAVDKKLFVRFGHKAMDRPGQVQVPDGLADQVEQLMRKRCLEHLALCNRAGQLVGGFEKVRSRLENGKSHVVVMASDVAAGSRDKLCRGIENIRVIDIFTREELSRAMGLENAVHLAVLPGGMSEGFLRETDRYLSWLGNPEDQ
ncbi:RNA-binding protein [Emcibacter nanhaiensis]|uniref:RNA-binding protein n=1 Tax=Emcibacter nanhaiensis TaxID=1505037 RepID=UPI0015E43147|nr:RNA-binding protein [Emcibacter nanhaiensis]